MRDQEKHKPETELVQIGSPTRPSLLMSFSTVASSLTRRRGTASHSQHIQTKYLSLLKQFTDLTPPDNSFPKALRTDGFDNEWPNVYKRKRTGSNTDYFSENDRMPSSIPRERGIEVTPPRSRLPPSEYGGAAKPVLNRLEEFKVLIDAGLVRIEFIHQATPGTLELVRGFLARYTYAQGMLIYDGIDGPTIGETFIRHGILTPELIENIIICEDKKVKPYDGSLGRRPSDALKKLIELKGLSPPVALQLLKKNLLPDNRVIERLSNLVSSGTSNAINWGIVNILEYEVARNPAANKDRPRDKFLAEPHGLLRSMRTTEGVSEKRKQVKAVVADDDPRPFKQQLEAVWVHYATRSKLFRKIDLEDPICKATRDNNVSSVNTHQLVLNKMGEKAISCPEKRFIDLYGRYNCAEMDPFMLAIITRTVSWYVDNQHSSLFTNVRLVPDRFASEPTHLDAIPWAAKLASPKIAILKVQGQAFRSSLLGANRFFLTHSFSQDALMEGCIPIIGTSTWQNLSKLNDKEPYALFEADFDKKDRHRTLDRKWEGADHSLSIAGVITETLRALREVEMLEIARARSLPLELGENHRWQVVTDSPPSLLSVKGVLSFLQTLAA